MSSSSPASLLPCRLFLTGGSGYVGRNLVRHFTSLGVEVIALVRSAQARGTVEALGACAVEGDLFSSDLPFGMRECQALIHAAADTGHGLPSAAQRSPMSMARGRSLPRRAGRASGVPYT